MPLPRASLLDLSVAGVLLSLSQAVSIVRELISRVVAGELAGVPSPSVIRFSDYGLTIDGPVDAEGRDVAHAVQLLDALLPPSPTRVPGPLRVVMARATGLLDLPRYDSLEAFATALARFAAAEPADAIARSLATAWSRTPQGAAGAAAASETDVAGDARASEAASRAAAIVPVIGSPLTVSDIRRARRATFLSLTEIAFHSGIPVPRLLELEWGDLRNFPNGAEGHELLVRYARAAGLDETVVVDAIDPLLTAHAGRSAVTWTVVGEPALALELPVGLESSGLLPFPPVRPDVRSSLSSSRRFRRSQLAAAAVLLVAVTAAGLWQRATRSSAPGPTAAATAIDRGESTQAQP